ncbi:hypothetical protein KCU62_g5817, partial [Aureobasidium sp. EXF-3399]
MGKRDITISWYDPNSHCRQLGIKAQIESTVLAKAPLRVVHAHIRCGWHESPSDYNTHLTVNYTKGNGQKQTVHVRRDGSVVYLF